MDNSEQIERFARIVEKNKIYEGLAANPDFIKWREEQVNPALDYLRDDLLSTDRSKPDWKEQACDRLVAYQESVRIYETLFNMSVELARRSRSEIKRIEEVL